MRANNVLLLEKRRENTNNNNNDDGDDDGATQLNKTDDYIGRLGDFLILFE